MFTAPPGTMDPDKSTSLAEATTYQAPVIDRLTRVDKNLLVGPMLATSWKYATDEMSLELKLRTDAVFHSGNPVDAAAVKASIERGKTLVGSTQVTALSVISTVDVVDSSTVRLNLAHPDASVPALLATAAGSVMDPKVFGDPSVSMASDPSKAGSGAWLVSSFVPNQSAVYDRAPGRYWDSGAGLLKHVEIRFTSDQAARINAMRSNAADMAYINIGQSGNIKDLTSGTSYVLHRLPSLIQVALWFNDSKNQFANMKVRQAIKQAVDPTPIARDLLNGDCTVDPSIYPAATWAHTSVQDRFSYNPAQAKQALADAGASGLSFTAITNAGSASNDIAVALKEQLSAVGIDMKVQPGQTAANIPLYTSRNYEAFVNPISGTGDPNGILQNFIVGGYRIAGSEAEALKPLQSQAIDPKLDQAGRAKIYGQIAQKMLDDVVTVPICYATTPWLAASKVGGIDDMSWLPVLDFRNLFIKR